MTINTVYNDRNLVRGLSMAATAHVLTDASKENARAMDRLLARFPVAENMSPPAEPGQVVLVKLVPFVISVIDFARDFGHSQLVEICAGDLADCAPELGVCGNLSQFFAVRI